MDIESTFEKTRLSYHFFKINAFQEEVVNVQVDEADVIAFEKAGGYLGATPAYIGKLPP